MTNQIILGLGEATPDWWGDTSTPPATQPAPPPPAQGSSFLDKINNVLTVGSKIVQQGAGIVNSVKSALPGSSTTPGASSAIVPFTPTTQTTYASAPLGTGAKIAIGVGIVALGGGIIYAFSGGKKKKS